MVTKSTIMERTLLINIKGTELQQFLMKTCPSPSGILLPFSKRIIAVQLSSKAKNINIIQAYAPTANKPVEEIENFYSQISDILGKFKAHEINIVLGDFNANQNAEIPDLDDADKNLVGLIILQSEVEKALRAMKTGKAPGGDQIQAEVIKYAKAETLTKLFYKIYDTGEILCDWLKSTFVRFLKKDRAKSGDDYRFISLMSHMLKIV